MALNFLAIYFSIILCLSYWFSGHLYILGMISVRTRIDLYSTSFFILLGVVRGGVVVWSYYYMDGEAAFHRFILLLIIFLRRIVALIFFSNLFITLIGWDGLGLSSFLLVIYYKNRKRLGSGMITALTNRLGDCFFFCWIGFFLADGYNSIVLLLIVLLRITKSAQIPFSSWLPAAIAAPTPVSALVHSSTLVTAGVYLLIRYCHTDSGTLMYVGCVTMVMAGLRAAVERDIKKVVALSTLSQLGVIMISIGAHEKSYCFFHLISHASFKALLFLCIGTRIHILYGNQDHRRFNMLQSTLFVSIFSSVAILSLIGFVYRSGFYRKDRILESLYKSDVSSWLVCSFLLGIGLTSCYSVKLLMRTMLVGSLTGTTMNSYGAPVWSIKRPFFLLGFLRISIGTIIRNYRRLLFIPLNFFEKIIPLCLIVTGAFIGYALPCGANSFLRSLLTLTPLSQSGSTFPLSLVQQKLIDKGWVERATLSVTSLSASLIHQYIPVIVLGLRSLILVIFFY